MTRRAPTVDDLRVKLCYICREEERYDDNTTRAWTHPCKCTLIAHEHCLLKWIQTSQGTSVRAANALRCPQCGAKYELESKYPVLLKFLSTGNRSLQQLGRLFTLFGVASFICVVGSSIYVICTAYGAWALRKFIGKEMYDTLLTDDTSNWPWSAYVNLPLIPISLIFSRTHQPLSVPFIVPILLAWPPSWPVGLRQQLLREYWTNPSNARQLALTALPSKQVWPPSPIAFGMILVPLARAAYRILYKRLAFWVLGATANSLLPGGRRRPNGGQIRGGEIEINVNVAINEEDEDHEVHPAENDEAGRRAENPDRQRQQGRDGLLHRAIWGWNELAMGIRGAGAAVDQPNDANGGQAGGADAVEWQEAANAGEEARNDDNDVNGRVQNGGDQIVIQDLEANPAAVAVEAAEQQIEVNTTSLGRQIGGALLIPAISSWMGSLLFRLSRRSSLLRRFLGISPFTLSGMNEVTRWYKNGFKSFPSGLLLFPPPPLGPWSYSGWEGLSIWQKFALGVKLVANTTWGGTRTWAESDPVWWRNSIGLGLFVVAKDCLQLLHLWLTKRELETRRVRNRDFSGVDVNELDLIPTWDSD